MLGQESRQPRVRVAKTPTPKPPAATPAPAKPSAAVPANYEVAKGDTLFRIAGKTRHKGVTLNQMVLALYRANPDAFLDGNINQLVVGRTLAVPGFEAVTAVDAAQATQQLRTLVAKTAVPAAPPVPQPEEAAPPKPRPEPPSKPIARPPSPLAPDQAAERFQEGVKLEKSGDLRAAMQAYIAAGESGYGVAQKRLGDIYNTGNEVVRRDYETALRWYQKARAQGIEIPKPITRPGVRH